MIILISCHFRTSENLSYREVYEVFDDTNESVNYFTDKFHIPKTTFFMIVNIVRRDLSEVRVTTSIPLNNIPCWELQSLTHCFSSQEVTDLLILLPSRPFNVT